MDDDARTRRSGVGGRPYPPELRESAAQMRRQGLGGRVIAEKLGISRATLARWFREDGVLPHDLVRHERGKRWADEMSAKRAEDPERFYPGHRRLPPELRATAAEMRRQGIGRATIARELGVGPSTVGRWFREDQVDLVADGLTGRAAARAAYRRVVDERWAEQDAEQQAHADLVGPLTDRERLLVGAALYWAEGSKAKPWRRSQVVSFMNSDPDVIRCFIAFLELLGVPRDTITCRLQIHRTADVQAALEWWREQVGEDLRFYRPTLKKHVRTTVRHNVGEGYHGCLGVHVLDSAGTYRRIVGTWQGVAKGVVSPPSPVV